jgi:hypothetical protein
VSEQPGIRPRRFLKWWNGLNNRFRNPKFAADISPVLSMDHTGGLTVFVTRVTDNSLNSTPDEYARASDPIWKK